MKESLLRLLPLLGLFLLSACLKQTQTDEGSLAIPASEKPYASGTKGVKLILSDAPNGSFDEPTGIPAPSLVPIGPGAGLDSYSPGVSAKRYFQLDGVTAVAKPSWISDVQLGITEVPSNLGGSVQTPSKFCASFGRYDSSTRKFDSDRFYRVSENDCFNYQGEKNDSQVFIRVILDRDAKYLGTRENLMLQLEYQATGLRANSDGSDPNPERNLDHLWKVFWGQTLSPSAQFAPFSIFIPPNYADWCRSGSGQLPTTASPCPTPDPSRVAPVVVRQILIPLASNPDPFVIQIQRVLGRINSDDGYVKSFCSGSNSPLCLGVVFRSLSILRL